MKSSEGIKAVNRIWKDLSVSKKLYLVVGVMGLLIALELFTLRFAMTTLSSVRAFVGGEGLWSKAQKTAVLNLYKYAKTREPLHYQKYLEALQVPMGDRQARLELAKPDPDFEIITQGFIRGQVDPADIPGVIHLVRRFHDVEPLKKALAIWEEGDRLLGELTTEASRLHTAISGGASDQRIQNIMNRVDDLDAQLTIVENNFSYALGAASRWLENLLLTVLLIAVLTVEGTGILLTVSLSRNLSRSLQELKETTAAIGTGDFTRRVPIRSKDEIGELGVALNSMAAQLEESIGGKKQAEQASEVKSQFLAHMSHEIRTPLGAMLGFAELLKDKKLSSSEREAYVEIMLRTGNNLSKILNDVLDISKVEAGQMDIEKIRCFLPALLLEIYEVMKVKCASKGLRLAFAQEADLPEWIYTDPFRLRQILINLIGNALKFTDHGEVRVSVKVEGHLLVFRVKDSGVGLNEEQRQRLFIAFSQANNSMNRKHEGTGLGLILSKRLASLLGGDVTLQESSVGKGSIFTVKIPLELKEPPTLHQTNPKTPTAQVTQPAYSFEGKRVLVVDDTPDNRYLIEKLLTRRGFRVEHAENGQEGVQKALHGTFDLVLMDVQMPIMDGYEAVRLLRERHYDKPVIAVTAHAMKGDRLSCLDAGYSDYLTKPIQVNEFFRVLAQHLHA